MKTLFWQLFMLLKDLSILILYQIMNSILPRVLGACAYCNQKELKLYKNIKMMKYYEELSVFYVGFTRAIKSLLYLSDKRLNTTAENHLCKLFLSLKSI